MAVVGRRDENALQAIYYVLDEIRNSMHRQEKLLASIYGHAVDDKGTGLYSIAKNVVEIREVLSKMESPDGR